MKILSRLLVIVLVLAGLAYSSYAVGRYALSKYLFGPQVTPGSGSGLEVVSRSTKAAAGVTRQTDWKGHNPRVELKVLPAGEAGPGPDLPLAAMDQDPNETTSDVYETPDKSTTGGAVSPDSVGTNIPRRYEGSRNVDNARVNYSLSDGENRSNGERPRRRRRRRKKPTTDSTTRATTSTPSTDTNYYPAPDDSASAPASERPPAPVISDSGSSSSNIYPPAPSTRASDSSPKRSTKRSRRRKPARQRHESPVPRPEGGGRLLDSGNSPVPLPE